MKLLTPLGSALGAVLLLGTASSARAQEPQVQISASVDVVRLSVAVVNSTGGEVPPLSLEDFRVYDNGVLQNVRLLNRPTDTPLRVALVFDASPSVRPWWPTVQRTAVTFLAKLGRGGCPYVLPFSDGIGPGRWGRYTANNWREFLSRVPRGAGTSLHDALIVALGQLAMADQMAIDASQSLREPPAAERSSSEPGPVAAADPSEVTRADLLASLERILAEIVRNNPFTHIGNCDLRYVPAGTGDEDTVQLPEDESIKAVLLLSDGADTTSISTAQDAIDAARVVNVPVFPVMLGNAGRDPALEELLTEIARATGGFVTRDVSPTNLGDAYDRVLGYLRASYVLVYNPDEPAERGGGEPGESPQSWHEIRVELRRPLLRTIVRPGYYR